MKDKIYSRSFAETVRGIDSVDFIEELFNKADGKEFIDKILYVDVMSYLPEDLLVKVDIASMAHSLEARSPFVDHQVMECAASLPTDLKLRDFEKKYFLKQIFADFLPEDILHRKKMGFVMPIERWLRQELKDMTYEMLLNKTSIERGYFNVEAIKTLLDDHMSGQFNYRFQIWNLLCLEQWHRLYMDGEISAPVQ